MRQFFSQIFRWTKEKIEINYLYFSLLLIVASALVFARFFLMKSDLFGPSFFFILHAMGQLALEIGTLVLVAYCLKRWAAQILYSAFVSICFTLLVLHLTDLVIGNILDASIGYAFKFLLGFGLSHLAIALQACNMNERMIVIILGAILSIPLSGFLLYQLTRYIGKNTPLHLSFRQIVLFLSAITLTLFFLDLGAYPFLDRKTYTRYEKTLPFGTTLLSPKQHLISLPSPIKPPREETDLEKILPTYTLSQKPNIYLFVIETLRKDFIDEKTAPSLFAFGNQHLQFPSSFANANCTQLSWFSIFHSDYPFHWAMMRNRWEKGSVPLQILKKMGYQIQVYCSANLHLFGMDTLIFGKNRYLADQLEEYSEDDPSTRDLQALQSLEEDLQQEENKEGRVFIVFLDSTHSEYSFPKDFPLQFTPMAHQIDYLTFNPKDLEPIKNRYRTAVSFIDSLMERFFQRLKKENLYEEGIIAITGDHGEEFFEEGALFHGTHLNHVQTSVPILFKFQTSNWTPQTKSTTHIDLFPSILHYLTKEADFSPFFDGTSIFALNRWPYRIAALQNGPLTPVEFTLSNETLTITARFTNPQNLSKNTEIEILSLQTAAPPLKNFEESLPNLFLPLLKK